SMTPSRAWIFGTMPRLRQSNRKSVVLAFSVSGCGECASWLKLSRADDLRLRSIAERVAQLDEELPSRGPARKHGWHNARRRSGLDRQILIAVRVPGVDRCTRTQEVGQQDVPSDPLGLLLRHQRRIGKQAVVIQDSP